MNEKEKMLAGKIYDPTDEELTRLRTKAHRHSQRYNTYKKNREKSQFFIFF
ncbi:MAG: maltose acetyltransferase domain-containing protein [Lachnoanaerobaculum saburreum]